MIARYAVIQQQRGWLADIEQQDIDVAIVIDVAKCCAATRSLPYGA